MSKFRETTVSNCEKKFVEQCLSDSRRIDERAFDEYRELKIQFGSDWGSCHVSLGKTQVLAQVSCEVTTPNSTRPSEGILYVNLELSPLAAPQFEPGRQSDLSVQLNRLLEKCIKDSKAVDLESLCIKVNEKVWQFRVDCNVLNDEGNIVDCASIAALSALAHFRRPDVTCNGEEIVIHTYAQRDSIPTVIHHYPVCVSYAIFSNGEVILADPSLLEEQVADAELTIGLNSYKELCGFHLGGSAMMSPEQILQATNKAATRANLTIAEIKQALAKDAETRENNISVVGFCNSYLFDEGNIEMDENLLSDFFDAWTVQSSKKRGKQSTNTGDKKECQAIIENINKASAELIPPHSEDGTNKWKLEDEENEDSDLEDVQFVEEKVEIKVEEKEIKMDTDSEEETTIVLNADKMTKKTKNKNKARRK